MQVHDARDKLQVLELADTHSARGQHWQLRAVVAQVADHLVTHALATSTDVRRRQSMNVPAADGRRQNMNVPATEQWLVLNDFTVAATSRFEAVHVPASGWKVAALSVIHVHSQQLGAAATRLHT